MINNHPYLKNKVVNIIPTPAGLRWNNMVKKGTEAEMKEAGFFYLGAMKGYAIQLTANGIPKLLNDTEKKACPDRVDAKGDPKELTEREYFEQVLGLNLDIYNEESDWFKVKRADHTFKPTYVNIPNGELELNLMNPAHMLIYKVACSRQDKIAPSKEAYNKDKRESQIFMMVDATSNDSEVVDNIVTMAEASQKFLSASGNRKEMLKYFTTKGIVISDNISDVDLKKRFALDFNSAPADFLQTISNPDADMIFIIRKARSLGIIGHNPKTDKFELPDSGFTGKLVDIINYFREPKHSEELINLEIQVEQIKR